MDLENRSEGEARWLQSGFYHLQGAGHDGTYGSTTSVEKINTFIKQLNSSYVTGKILLDKCGSSEFFIYHFHNQKKRKNK